MMRIHLKGERAKQSPRHIVHVSPAGHLAGQEMPADWVTDENKPVMFSVEFKFGVAEVPSNLGEYMVKYELAARTWLVLPSLFKAA